MRLWETWLPGLLSSPEWRHVSIIQVERDSCGMGRWNLERACGSSFQLDDHTVRPAVDTIITKKRLSDYVHSQQSEAPLGLTLIP